MAERGRRRGNSSTSTAIDKAHTKRVDVAPNGPNGKNSAVL